MSAVVLQAASPAGDEYSALPTEEPCDDLDRRAEQLNSWSKNIRRERSGVVRERTSSAVRDVPLAENNSARVLSCSRGGGGGPISGSITYIKSLCFRRDRVFIVICTTVWVFVGVWGCRTGIIVDDEDVDGLTATETIYLMGQIATTVGYGDYTPKLNRGMYFMSAYALFSGLFIAGTFMEAVDSIADAHQSRLDGVIGVLLDDGDEEHESFLERYQSLLMAAIAFITALAMWTFFYSHFFCDLLLQHWETGQWTDDVCEDMPFAQAFYFGVTSLTTIGFGDIVPTTSAGQIFSVSFGFLGIATYFNLVGSVAEKLMHIKAVTTLDKISEQDFDLADVTHDGQIDLYEFTRFVLRRYDLVSANVLDSITKNFNDLDADRSGFITHADMAVSLVKKRGRNVSESSPRIVQ